MSKTILNQTDRVVDNTEYFVLATSGANWRSKNDSTGVFSSVPIIIGGSAAGSTVTIESTSGAGSTDAIFFKTGSQVERLRIDTSGQITMGGTANQTSNIFEIDSLTTGPSSAFISWTNDTNSPNYQGMKSRGAAIGTHSIVLSGDVLFQQIGRGSDGTAFQRAASIQIICDGTPGAGSMPGAFIFNTTPTSSTTPSERLRIDSVGRAIHGGTAGLSIGGNNDQIQNYGVDAATGGITLGMFNATAATSAHLDFYRSKNATLGSATVVASGDDLGDITWYGAQQTGTFATQNPAAQIAGQVDGTVTSGAGADMPGRLSFKTTPDASGTLTERMRIDSLGLISTSTCLVGGALGGCNATTTSATTYTVLDSDLSINCTGSATCTLTLPTTSTYNGRVLYVHTEGAFTVVSAGSNVKPIGGGAAGTAILPATSKAWAILILQTNAIWDIVASGTGT